MLSEFDNGLTRFELDIDAKNQAICLRVVSHSELDAYGEVDGVGRVFPAHSTQELLLPAKPQLTYDPTRDRYNGLVGLTRYPN